MKRNILIAAVVFAIILINAIVYSVLQFPNKEKIRGCLTTQFYSVYLCPGSKDYVRLNQISSVFRKTVVLSEDSLFWQHQGFDWLSLEQNFKEGLEDRKFRRGGSTISQQLAKNMFLTNERTFVRKAKEALITLRIEKHLSKNEILERYLNVIEYGPKIYGIKSAAQHYFSKHPSELDLAESAFLVMMLPNPKKYSQSFRNKKLTNFAERRCKQIIENMYQYKMASYENYELALARLPFLVAPEVTIEDIANPEGAADAPPPETTEESEEETDDEFFL